jgi:apolipoprotein N-acyltransferase
MFVRLVVVQVATGRVVKDVQSSQVSLKDVTLLTFQLSTGNVINEEQLANALSNVVHAPVSHRLTSRVTKDPQLMNIVFISWIVPVCHELTSRVVREKQKWNMLVAIVQTSGLQAETSSSVTSTHPLNMLSKVSALLISKELTSSPSPKNPENLVVTPESSSPSNILSKVVPVAVLKLDRSSEGQSNIL